MPESELKTIMKKVAGIGQASSRGEIVRELLQTGYIEEREKGGLYMTGERAGLYPLSGWQEYYGSGSFCPVGTAYAAYP